MKNPKKTKSHGVERGDHEVIVVRGRLIPILGTVGGSPEESRETAGNIERYLQNNKQHRTAQRAIPAN